MLNLNFFRDNNITNLAALKLTERSPASKTARKIGNKFKNAAIFQNYALLSL